MIYRLENTIQNYAWGSTALMPEFLGGQNPEKKPWAELWMGAHPKAPSLARPAAEPAGEGIALDRLIASDLAAFLGGKNARVYGGLPFLFKLLAVGSPLSIQCHPNPEQARAGFARENSLGIPLSADGRNYRDTNHKPEIILALTSFTACRGLRPAARIISFFDSLPVPAFSAFTRALKKDAGEKSLKAFLRALLSPPPGAARQWIAAVKEHGAFIAEEAGPEYETFCRLADFYPEDTGVFAPFYLNLVSLKPGEALFIGPGEMHAYLSGLGIELMANSDNVLRAGLTPKHIDAEELLSVVDCRPALPEILLPETLKRGGFTEKTYPRRADEFGLSALFPADGAETELPVSGPEILFCGGGNVRVRAGVVSAPLVTGASLFIPASEKTYTLSGKGVLYRARVPA